MQHLLKPLARIAWARIVATELLDEFFVAVDDALAALDPGFGGETLPAFAHWLKSRTRRRCRTSGVWHTPLS